MAPEEELKVSRRASSEGLPKVPKSSGAASPVSDTPKEPKDSLSGLGGYTSDIEKTGWSFGNHQSGDQKLGEKKCQNGRIWQV